LRAADDRCIENLLVFDLAGHFIRFLDQSIHGRTISAARFLTKLLEDLIETGNLILCFAEMIA
jgi:hypothetical protein